MKDQLSQEIDAEIRALVERQAQPFAIDRIDIRVGEDSDDEVTIFVDVWHPLTHIPVEARQLLQMQFAVRQLLLKHGDSRFPWVRQRFADGQKFGSAA